MGILTAVLGFLGPQIPTLIKAVEGMFSGKPKSGDDKFTAVLDLARTLITKAIQAKLTLPDGSVITEQPTDDALRGAIEAVFQQMKTSGQLSTPLTQGELFIVRGTVTPIKL